LDIDGLIVLLLAAQFKIGIYVFWKLCKRLDKIERDNVAIKKSIMVLHKEEFKELRDSLNRININMLQQQTDSIGNEIIDAQAAKIEDDLWLKGETE